MTEWCFCYKAVYSDDQLILHVIKENGKNQTLKYNTNSKIIYAVRYDISYLDKDVSNIWKRFVEQEKQIEKGWKTILGTSPANAKLLSNKPLLELTLKNEKDVPLIINNQYFFGIKVLDSVTPEMSLQRSKLKLFLNNPNPSKRQIYGWIKINEAGLIIETDFEREYPPIQICVFDIEMNHIREVNSDFVQIRNSNDAITVLSARILSVGMTEKKIVSERTWILCNPDKLKFKDDEYYVNLKKRKIIKKRKDVEDLSFPKNVKLCFSENDIVSCFLEYTENVHHITAWNGGKFDYIHLHDKCPSYYRNLVRHSESKNVDYILYQIQTKKLDFFDEKVFLAFHRSHQVCMDSMILEKRLRFEQKLSLQHVAQKYNLDGKKSDVSFHRMHEIFVGLFMDEPIKGNFVSQFVNYIDYCIQDVNILSGIVEKTFMDDFQFAIECGTTLQQISLGFSKLHYVETNYQMFLTKNQLVANAMNQLCKNIYPEFTRVHAREFLHGNVIDEANKSVAKSKKRKIVASELTTTSSSNEISWIDFQKRPEFKHSNTTKKYEGAIVFCKKGIYKKVKAADYASLYPSVAIQYKIGQGTAFPVPNNFVPPRNKKFKILNNVANGIDCFCLDENLDNPIILFLQHCLDERQKVRKLLKGIDPSSVSYKIQNAKQTALKLSANGTYGLLGAKYGSFSSPLFASCITKQGRWSIQSAANIATRMGYEVVYVDTDSIYIISENEGELNETVDIINHKLFVLYSLNESPEYALENDLIFDDEIHGESFKNFKLSLASEDEYKMMFVNVMKRYVCITSKEKVYFKNEIRNHKTADVWIRKLLESFYLEIYEYCKTNNYDGSNLKNNSFITQLIQKLLQQFIFEKYVDSKEIKSNGLYALGRHIMHIGYKYGEHLGTGKTFYVSIIPEICIDPSKPNIKTIWKRQCFALLKQCEEEYENKQISCNLNSVNGLGVVQDLVELIGIDNMNDFVLKFTNQYMFNLITDLKKKMLDICKEKKLNFVSVPMEYQYQSCTFYELYEKGVFIENWNHPKIVHSSEYKTYKLNPKTCLPENIETVISKNPWHLRNILSVLPVKNVKMCIPLEFQFLNQTLIHITAVLSPKYAACLQNYLQMTNVANTKCKTVLQTLWGWYLIDGSSALTFFQYGSQLIDYLNGN